MIPTKNYKRKHKHDSFKPIHLCMYMHNHAFTHAQIHKQTYTHTHAYAYKCPHTYTRFDTIITISPLTLNVLEHCQICFRMLYMTIVCNCC